MKTKEELKALKEEVDALNKKLRDLTDEELAQITGGIKVILLDRPHFITPDNESAIIEPGVDRLPND